MSAEALRDGRQDTEFYNDLLAELIVEVTAGVYQLVTTTGISDRVMDTLREGRPNLPYFEDLISKCMLYDAGTGKYYLNVSGGGGGGGNLQTTLDAGNTADNIGIVLTENSVDNSITLEPSDPAIHLQKDSVRGLTAEMSLISGLTDVAGQITLKRIDTGTGIAVSNTIRALNANTGAPVNAFNQLQATNGVLIQDDNLSGVGLTINQADVIISSNGNAFIINDDTALKRMAISSNALRISETNGAGSISYDLISITTDALQFYDTTGSGDNVDIRPNAYNNQLITWPDITGSLKTVGTFNDTFVSGVIILTDIRFDIGQPNVVICITNTNSSSALAHAYKFEVLSLPSRLKITALKQNGTTETSDVSSVRISCLF